ncbi:MAG: hypothetical protein V3R99_06295 [Thermoguttaceae bacterium]
MFGQLIHRLAASPTLPAAEEESPAGQESPVRQWRVVSQDGTSSLFDLGFLADDPDGPERVESTEAENETEPAETRNDTTKNDIFASLSVGAPVIGSRQRPPTGPNIGMPAALPRTSEILQAAAASSSIETPEPSRPAGRHGTQPHRVDSSVKEAIHADSSLPPAGDGDAISRSLVADAAAAAPARFRQASPLALLKTAAGSREIDANLAKIIAQWPNLTRPVQAAVLAMIDAAARES